MTTVLEDGYKKEMKSAALVREQYDRLCAAVKRTEPHLPVIEKMADAVVEALQSGHKILTAGNGGSAADALHMAEELIGRYRSNRAPLPAVCLAADATALTCIANDFGYEKVFSRQVEALGQPGDVLVLFTGSGNSANIVEAARAARLKGVRIIALLGKGGGAMKGEGDIEWIVDDPDTARVQELHTWAMHVMLEAVEQVFTR
jgi:D-sedoheptulose 7-phosphate isomerase